MDAMNRAAEDYVKLVLAMGPHDEDYVDAYYGPESLKTEAEEQLTDLSSIRQMAGTVLTDLRDIDASNEEELVRLRHRFLILQLESLLSRADMLEGERLSFDEESRALYDATAPTHADSDFQETLDRLEKVLPGSGPLVERYDEFRKQFLVPRDRLDEVFETALEECRARTKPYRCSASCT